MSNLQEEIRTRLIYAGIDEPPQEAVNSMAELFSSKFSELEREIENMETYNATDPFKSSGMNIVITDALKKSDVLSLFPQEREK